MPCATHVIVESNLRLIPAFFDACRLRPGWRCISRHANYFPVDARQSRATATSLKAFVIDHAAQILTASNDNDQI